MKTLLLSILLSISIFALEIDEFSSHMGYQRDYNTALALAKKENKPLFLLVGTDYCPWCRKFERKTLQSPAVAKFIKDNFVTVIIDKNLDKGKFPKKYRSPITPVVYMINPLNQETIGEQLGYMKKKDFINVIKNIINQHKKG